MSEINQVGSPFKYGENDFESIRSQLLEIVPEITEDWTDFNTSDVSTIILDLMVRLNDYNSYRRDMIASELLIGKAKQRENVKEILKLISYKMHSYIPSVTEAVISAVDWVPTKVMDIPPYSQFAIKRDGSGPLVEREPLVLFSNLSNVRIQPGQPETHFFLHQGEVKVLQFQLREIDGMGRVYLPEAQVAVGTIQLQVKSNRASQSDSKLWEEVEDVVQVPDAGLYFSHEVDKDGKNYIQLHPMYKVSIGEQSVLVVKYLVTLGKEAKVGSGKVAQILTKLIDSDNIIRTGDLKVINTTSAIGGSDPESIEHAKRHGPLSVKVMDTAVTLEDYEIIVERIPGIVRCKALDWNFPESGITVGYVINLYVILENGYTLNEAYKKELLEVVNKKRLGTIKLDVMEPIYKPLEFIVDVKVDRSSLYKGRVMDKISNEVRDIFSPYRKIDGTLSIDFGQIIYLSYVESRLQMCDPDVLSVSLRDVNTDFTSTVMEFIKLGNFSVNLIEV